MWLTPDFLIQSLRTIFLPFFQLRRCENYYDEYKHCSSFKGKFYQLYGKSRNDVTDNWTLFDPRQAFMKLTLYTVVTKLLTPSLKLYGRPIFLFDLFLFLNFSCHQNDIVMPIFIFLFVYINKVQNYIKDCSRILLSRLLMNPWANALSFRKRMWQQVLNRRSWLKSVSSGNILTWKFIVRTFVSVDGKADPSKCQHWEDNFEDCKLWT